MIKKALTIIFIAGSLFATQKPIIGSIDLNKMAEEKNITELESLAKNNPYMADINFMIGVYYMAGDKERNLPPDFKKAMDYFLKDQNNLAMANYKIAELYYYGYGVEKDYFKSIEYFKKSVDKKFKDYKSVAPLSLLAISNIYLEKLFDYENAVPYLMQAAQDFNRVEAEMTIAFMYYEGKGLPKDEKEANVWINKAYFNKDATGEHKAYISNYIEPVNSFDIQSDVKNYCGVLK
ncbi:sel1 repeat family protein [Aliarcobacter butzleri]|uniref:tetratricopeptide repeat protein n=1 Tax=Aliarcobacter butzleri TaxID=28197 RepID=UPI0021B2C2ED|nr:tetratricopeptide repeat protein [Aliarcobacter butzleri]MCT7563175.1 sel1 repeat family protein [Aliarcobacter butzleri]